MILKLLVLVCLVLVVFEGRLILTMFPGNQQMVIYCEKEKKRIGASCLIHEALVDELTERLGKENVVVK